MPIVFRFGGSNDPFGPGGFFEQVLNNTRNPSGSASSSDGSASGSADGNAPGSGTTIFIRHPNGKERKPVGTPVTRTLVNLIVTAVAGLLWFYFTLPALNLQAEEVYFFIFLLCAVYALSALVTSGSQAGSASEYFRFAWRQCRIPCLIVGVMIIIYVLGSFSSWVVIRAGRYSALLPLDDGDFTAEVEEIRYDQIPMLDADSAALLGNRKLGELADMVSQFEILAGYAEDGNLSTTQINLQGRPVRVTSLAYGDIIKWFNNRAEGLPAYIVIDMVTREAEVIRLPEGMKFTVAEHFGRNLYRHLRFHYPSMMFDTPVFEIDEEGTPYWVCPRMVKTIGLFGGIDIRGAVLVNAITGESEYMEEVPSWVDRLYSANIIIRQYDYYGRYHNGFWNSIFGQRDVTVTTDGYNYIAIDDDVYMYTGITSVTADESNIGFILSNLRTKETRFYSIAGAEEYSAMDSAQSQVQQMRYTATFPLLLNIADQPTYFMALKGLDGLVKMYAMVNVQQYDIVSTGATVGECETSYRQTLIHRGLIADTVPQEEEEPYDVFTGDGIIREIRTAVISGSTHFYVRVEGNPSYLDFSAEVMPRAVLLTTGDHIYYGFTLEDEAGDSGIVHAVWFRLEGEDLPVT